MTSLWALALLPMLGAALVGLLPTSARRSAALLAGAVALACLGVVLAAAPAVFGGQVLTWGLPWLPELGLNFAFRLDGLAWLFAFLITGIGCLIVLYAAYYLSPDDPSPRFFSFLLLFMGAMLGAVTAGNLVLLVVYWELTSIASFLLIGYWHHRDDAREGARMALFITGMGGLALLGGVLLLGHMAGSFELSVVLARGDVIREHALYEVTLILVLLGCFTKSAQFPFHFWLPHAMAAPTPVSAYLHSATMVKLGVFLLARLYPALGGTESWFWIVSLTGLATLIVGAYVAIFKHDLKGLLAYSTISHLGLITLLFGLSEPLAVVAGVFHIINHATFKAGLFMAAGIIDHESGSRDMRQLNGLMKFMPITGSLAIIASCAMAGVPLFNGFLSKEMFLAETVTKDTHALMEWLLPVGATVAAICSVAYSLRFVHDVFYNGEPVNLPRTPHEPPWFMRLPVEVLCVLCLAVGLVPNLIVGDVLAVAAQGALHGGPGALPTYKLAIWHGFNVPLLLSMVALVGGTLLYFSLQRGVNLHTTNHLPRGGRDVFATFFAALQAGVESVTGLLQSQRMQHYLLWLVLTVLVLGGYAFWFGPTAQVPAPAQPLPTTPPSAGFVAVWLIGMAATLATVWCHAQRLLALLLMGAAGLGVALLFVYFSAPDLALTQLLVEMVTVMLMMLALHWLPAASVPERVVSLRDKLRRWRDAALAIAAGVGVTAIVWQVLTRPFDSISPYFLETTIKQGGGANAVNVIIVDYRGFDTLGEITVLGIAGLIVFALLQRVSPHGHAPAPGQAERDRHPLMLKLIARLLLPFAVLITLHLFLRGHNLPGGGFIAGLVLAIAIIVMYVANGHAWMDARSRGDYRGWIGWGLLVAGLSGIGSWFVGHPFLTSTYDYPWVPGIGGIALASASLFDFGVFLTVVGATVLALLSIARLRAPERAATSKERT
jgi:multicomponent K+:H+ antiporter subunit A